MRRSGDTKTAKSRRSLRLADRCVEVLATLAVQRDRDREDGAKDGKGLVFRTWSGKPLSAGNVRRAFRKVLTKARLVAEDWTPRELRHSFVSLLSAHDIPIEDISQLVGHSNTVVTESPS